ncbi:hypothetical protein ANN_12701 [Periplaneta americana]|uniref:Reverse transcriptase domain-containing protein n=1 Tax=Periplaneta americana TaxID=6978 RepID=A0ABQ8TJJ4_PERAM|nr:hypothetical protein ANN_12701 [Periplaneta americana]
MNTTENRNTQYRRNSTSTVGIGVEDAVWLSVRLKDETVSMESSVRLIIILLENPEIYRRPNTSPPSVLILSKINPVYIITSHYHQSHFYIIITSTFRLFSPDSRRQCASGQASPLSYAKGCSVHEEVHYISEDDSHRRADIIAINRQQQKAVIIDPTIRMERDLNQAHQVDHEKRAIYESCIPHLSAKYNIPLFNRSVTADRSQCSTLPNIRKEQQRQIGIQTVKQVADETRKSNEQSGTVESSLQKRAIEEMIYLASSVLVIIDAITSVAVNDDIFSGIFALSIMLHVSFRPAQLNDDDDDDDDDDDGDGSSDFISTQFSLLVYADDVNTQTIRENTEILLEASKAIGLEVNPEKTKYMIMSRDQNIVRNGNIKIGDLSFEEVEKFKYLGPTVTNINDTREEIKHRINIGNACYYSVEKLLSSSLLSKNLKVRIYKTVILPVVLYGCETWTLTLREEQRLRVFENKVLRKIFGAKRDEVTGEWRKLHNTELHALYSSPDIIRNIKSRRLRWAGHVARMGESRNAYRVLVGRPEGKRPLGRPRRRWEDNIKMDLREMGYDDRDWINLTQDRDRWRAYVRAAMNLRVP